MYRSTDFEHKQLGLLQIITSYHAHGEYEQYHSEIKTDMDVERLPSGKFETNPSIMDAEDSLFLR